MHKFISINLFLHKRGCCFYKILYIKIMKILKYINKKRPYFIFLISLFISYYLILTANFPSTDNHTSYCIFHNLTGYPCPACGTGRGMILMRYGHFHEALMVNPLAYLVFVFSAISTVWLIADLISGNETYFKAFRHKLSIKPITAIILFILVLLNWYWNIQKEL